MKRSPINRKSKRQSDYDREFEAMKPVVRERSQGFCEMADFFGRRFMKGERFIPSDDPRAEIAKIFGKVRNELCTKAATHVHHRKYRSRHGSNSLDNLINLCRPCHDWIHANPELSNQLGLSLHAGESEELC